MGADYLRYLQWRAVLTGQGQGPVLTSVTAAYLQHQEFEEFEVMVMLSQHLSFDELLAIDNAIVASIEPDMMARSAALMLPAMNIDDQTELYAGARAGARTARGRGR